MANTHVQATNIQNISGTSNATVKSSGVLNAGDSVYVRVLSNTGKNKYTVSFAGNRFSVTSQSQLEVGNSFKASVLIKDGSLLLVPEFTSNTLTSQSISIQNYLLALGIPNDGFSQQILQLFIGMGLKFDTQLANRIRLIASKFPGREKEAAEAALALIENGISPDIDTVMQLLSLLFGENNTNMQFQGQKKKKNEDTKHENDTDSGDIIKKLYGEKTDALCRKPGLLTVFNHRYVNKQHWLLFPIKYTMSINNELKKSIGNGNVRILLDLDKKEIKKTAIYLRFPEKSYMFMLQYNRVEFCIIPNIAQKYRQSHIDLIASLSGFNSNDIIYNSDLAENGFFTEKTTIKFINTEA
jgi:hypothetical protein